MLWILALIFLLPLQTTDTIPALLDRMEAAVLAQDTETYLSYIDLSDPVFAAEHTKWALGWTDFAPVTRFDLLARNLQIDGDEATADLVMLWVLENDPSTHYARFPALFRQDDDGLWRYAGENWITTETQHFRVRAAPGMEDIAEDVIRLLPDVYRLTTNSLDYRPTGKGEIKLYNDAQDLIATTLLNLPRITGWNEPNESIKLAAGIENMTLNRLAFVLIHEFTHKLTFEMSNDSYGNFPWWLQEGLAQYVASELWTKEGQDEYLAQVRGWEASGSLLDWETMADFESTPTDQWVYVYPQGYALVRYVTETFSTDTRNEWLKAMAVEMTLPDATQEILGLSFEELDQDFRAWLADEHSRS